MCKDWFLYEKKWGGGQGGRGGGCEGWGWSWGSVEWKFEKNSNWILFIYFLFLSYRDFNVQLG